MATRGQAMVQYRCTHRGTALRLDAQADATSMSYDKFATLSDLSKVRRVFLHVCAAYHYVLLKNFRVKVNASEKFHCDLDVSQDGSNGEDQQHAPPLQSHLDMSFGLSTAPQTPRQQNNRVLS
jgi:hypothetical protein